MGGGIFAVPPAEDVTVAAVFNLVKIASVVFLTIFCVVMSACFWCVSKFNMPFVKLAVISPAFLSTSSNIGAIALLTTFLTSALTLSNFCWIVTLILSIFFWISALIALSLACKSCDTLSIALFILVKVWFVLVFTS